MTQKIIVEINGGSEKPYGVVWVSMDGRMKTRWHVTLDEAVARWEWLRKTIGKDAGLYIKIDHPELIKPYMEPL